MFLTSPINVVASTLPKEPVEVTEPLIELSNSNPLVKLPLIPAAICAELLSVLSKSVLVRLAAEPEREGEVRAGPDGDEFKNGEGARAVRAEESGEVNQSGGQAAAHATVAGDGADVQEVHLRWKHVRAGGRERELCESAVAVSTTYAEGLRGQHDGEVDLHEVLSRHGRVSRPKVPAPLHGLPAVWQGLGMCVGREVG